MGRASRRLDPSHLASLGRPLRRSERRQLRKRLGKAAGVEWRLPGRTPDDLNREIVKRARAKGHLSDRLR